MVAGSLLNTIYTEAVDKTSAALVGKCVTLIQDGWSNVNGEPIIGTAVYDGEKVFFVNSKATGSNAKTTEYWVDFATKTIQSVQKNFNCKVSEKFRMKNLI